MADAAEQGPGIDDAANALAENFTLGVDNEEEQETQNASEESEQETEETEDTQGTQAEAEEAEGEGEETEEQEEAGEVELSTVKALAEQLEVDPADLLSNLSHEINGSEVALSDIVGSFQDRETLQAQTEAYKNLYAQQQQQVEQWTQDATVMNEQLLSFEKTLSEGLNAPDMIALRTTDPAEWAARTQEIQNRITGIQQQRGQLGEQYRQVMEQQKADYFTAQGKILQAEVEGWGQDKLNTAVEVIKGFGFSDAEVGEVGDARLIKAALKMAALEAENKALKENQKTVKKAVKKIKAKVPAKKTLTPGQQAEKEQPGKVSKGKILSLQKKLKQSGRVDDAAALLMAKDI